MRGGQCEGVRRCWGEAFKCLNTGQVEKMTTAKESSGALGE